MLQRRGNIMNSDENKGCNNCKNNNVDDDNEPCVMCNGESGWERKDERMKNINNSCDNCEYEDRTGNSNPCDLCIGASQWLSKIKKDNKAVDKSCENCKDASLDLDNEPCRHCNKYDKWKSGWEVENMNKNDNIEEDIEEIDNKSEEEIHRLEFRNSDLEAELEIYKASEKAMTEILSEKIKRLNEMEVSNKLITSKESIMHSILKTLESWQGDDKECLNIENGNMDEFIHDIKINVSREFKTEGNNKVCEATPDYKYEYEKVAGENIKLKQYTVMYKEVIENLAMLLNKEI